MRIQTFAVQTKHEIYRVIVTDEHGCGITGRNEKGEQLNNLRIYGIGIDMQHSPELLFDNAKELLKPHMRIFYYQGTIKATEPIVSVGIEENK